MYYYYWIIFNYSLCPDVDVSDVEFRAGEDQCVVAHLDYVDDVIRQPESSESDDDGEDELLAAHSPLEWCLSQVAENTHVTADDDPVGQQEAQHRLHAHVERLLFTGIHINNLHEHQLQQSTWRINMYINNQESTSTIHINTNNNFH